MEIKCTDTGVQERQYWLQSLIGPRPVALVSTVDAAGNVNLAPFSFFNLFSSEPPVVIFSPCRSVRTGEQKDTLLNILEVPECVINIVDVSMAGQLNITSAMYGRGVNEYVAAGLTPIPATLVKPPMVKQSKAQLECTVTEVKPLGQQGGAGNLVICEVQVIHVSDELLRDGKMQQDKLEHLARLGGDWYCSVRGNSLFELGKPTVRCIGIPGLPASIRNNRLLTPNHLAALGTVESIPVLVERCEDPKLGAIHTYYRGTQKEERMFTYAGELLDAGKVGAAWQALLSLQVHLLTN